MGWNKSVVVVDLLRYHGQGRKQTIFTDIIAGFTLTKLKKVEMWDSLSRPLCKSYTGT